jgi:hypothetical protein
MNAMALILEGARTFDEENTLTVNNLFPAMQMPAAPEDAKRNPRRATSSDRSRLR